MNNQPKLVIADATALPARANLSNLLRSTKVDTAKCIGRYLPHHNAEVGHAAVTVKKAGVIVATIYF